MKYKASTAASGTIRRSPCGERGLKSLRRVGRHVIRPSLPMRGAWIEMIDDLSVGNARQKSLPMRGAWIEITLAEREKAEIASLPMRGAWIEIKS